MQDAIACAGRHGAGSKKLLENKKSQRKLNLGTCAPQVMILCSPSGFSDICKTYIRPILSPFLRCLSRKFLHFLVSSTLICALIYHVPFLNIYPPVKVNIQKQTGNSPVLLGELGHYKTLTLCYYCPCYFHWMLLWKPITILNSSTASSL